MLLNEFVGIVESQNLYNSKAGRIIAIHIIGYHSMGTTRSFGTSIELFEREIKYLHTNGIKVLKLTDLGYDQKENHFYIKLIKHTREKFLRVQAFYSKIVPLPNYTTYNVYDN